MSDDPANAIVFGPLSNELNDIVNKSQLNDEQKGQFGALALKVVTQGLTGNEVIDGIKLLQQLGKDISTNNGISAFMREFFNKMILNGKMRDLDAIFEPRGNLLTGLEPQLAPLPKLNEWPEHTPLLLIPAIAGTALFAGTNPVQRYWVNFGNLTNGTEYENNLAATYNVQTNVLISNKNVYVIDELSSVCNLDGINGVLPGFEAIRLNANTNLLGALPYDWRMMLANGTFEQFSIDLTNRITALYNSSNKKVYVLAHSAGNLLLALYLYQNKSSNVVKDKLEGIICVSPPFGGCCAAIDAVVRGQQKVVRISQLLLGSYPMIAMGLPNMLTDTPVVTYAGKTYYGSQMSAFLRACSFTSGDTAPIYDNIIRNPNYFGNFSFLKEPLDPNLKIFLLTSQFEATTIKMEYIEESEEWTDIKESMNPFGDGTVPYNSLHALDNYWNIPDSNKRTYYGVNHTQILSHPQFLTDIEHILVDGTLPQKIQFC